MLLLLSTYIKINFTPEQATKVQSRWGGDIYLYTFCNLGARWGWSTPRPGRFTPGKVPVSEAGWAPWPVWTDAKNLAPTGIRSPDRPARSEHLYRLSYPGPPCLLTQNTEITNPRIFCSLWFRFVKYNRKLRQTLNSLNTRG